MPSLLENFLSLFRAKKPVPTPMRTDAIAMLPVRAREDAFFSATVQNARLLQAMHERVAAEIALVEHGGSTMSQGKFVSDMRRILGVDGPGRDDMEDIASVQRLKLIHDFQVEKARAHTRWVHHTQSEVARDAFPAQELIRDSHREKPRDWGRRWVEAGGQFYEGRMIARVDDPVWERISRFGTPYPPFDFNSGMGVQSIGRSEAERLGVIGIDEQVGAPEDPSEKEISVSASGLGTEGEKFLKSLYGPALEIRDGNVFLPRKLAAAQVAAHDTRRAANAAQSGTGVSPVWVAEAANARGGYHEWREDAHPRDEQCRFTVAGQVAMGSKSLEFSLRRNADVKRAMMHNEIGRIDFEWGRPGTPKLINGKTHIDGYGISHVQAKHPEYLRRIPEIIAKGEVRPSSVGDPNKAEIHYQGERVVLSKKSPKTPQTWRPLHGKSLHLSKRRRAKHYYTVTSFESD